MSISDPNSIKNILSTEEKSNIALQFITALKTRDWDLMRSIITEDCTWTLPGTSVISGEAIGADAVIKRAQRLRDFGVMVQLNHILIGLYGVTLSLHNTAVRGDLQLDQYVAIVCELEDHKISKLATHLHNVDGINVFFVEGII
ncbi:hypothetical protein CLV51_103117 [Chitinophaga niastensis]|uniref:SnoaL-like domain-containing protein n=1 Tax=Chitinophaga niastensis TaxID=536980 RepID=A0A2P8HIU9_CHINA|nr:nuclear transport factor 2 family protein [Chitinophaga niastensis]PSL46141.1 hypothetical protein CLV51_103117 [Chitinophaga niastensis]